MFCSETMGQFQNKPLFETTIEIDDQLKWTNQEMKNDKESADFFKNKYAIDDIETEYFKNTSVIDAIGYEMAKTLPYYRSFTERCKKPVNAQSCLEIAELQIDSKTILEKSIGYGIKINSLEILNKDKNIIAEAELQYKHYSDSYSCYVKSPTYNLALTLNQDLK
jgi:hypothetical protein